MKERRSFSCGCAKIHELPISVFLLSFCLSSLCLSCLSFLSLSRPLPLESRVIASSVVSRRVSPRREESRVIASSVVSRRLSSRCASSSCSECQSRRVRSRVGVSRVSSCVVPLLGVSRVVCGVLPLCLSALCAVTASTGVSRHQVVCRVASCVSSRRASSRCSASVGCALGV